MSTEIIGLLATAEALLHAYGKKPHAQWAQDIARRWDRVRNAIATFEEEGIATKFGDVDVIAELAYSAESGSTMDETFDLFHAITYGG